MKRARWQDIRGELERRPAGRGPKDHEEFWTEFQARARLTRQEQPVAVPLWRLPVLRYGAGLAAATALALLVLVALPGASPVTRIRSLEVTASHTGVMILNDTAQGGTILWVTGMDTGSQNGG